MSMTPREKQELKSGLLFLAPNILGFLAFTIVPLILSLIMAFTNWDLRLHNIFKDNPLEFIGLENFIRLFHTADFWRFLGNTLFLMMGIPVAIAGSLMSALLLSQNLRGGSRSVLIALLATAGLTVSLIMFVVTGAHATAMVMFMGGVLCTVIVLGVVGGTTVYRTLFYLPHFCSGVATYILWKKLYNPRAGPINNFLADPLDAIGEAVRSAPTGTVKAGIWACYVVLALLLFFGIRRIRIMWRDSELGWAAAILCTAALLAPAVAALAWTPVAWPARMVGAIALVMLGWLIATIVRGRERGARYDAGLGNALMISAGLMVGQFIFIGLGLVAYNLPQMAASGLAPPEWLTEYHWAKPAIMIMAFWGAIGSNNMLLYLAGLSNIPVELYEAADIDGASWLQKFWNVTWPQLAPTTFFIVVMSVIGGLQGGFEMARTMTRGGPAGSTTTLAYFIYTEGFETGRLGYASAIAWALFLMVFVATLINWKFGNRYVTE